MMRSTVGWTFRLNMGSSFMIRACWSMWVHRNRHVYSLAAQSTDCITWEEKIHSRPLYSCRCWADTFKRTGSPAACHGAESNVVRRDAGRLQSTAVPNRRYASGGALLPSSPGGPLYDCDGFMAPTYYSGDRGTSATGDM